MKNWTKNELICTIYTMTNSWDTVTVAEAKSMARKSKAELYAMYKELCYNRVMDEFKSKLLDDVANRS